MSDNTIRGEPLKCPPFEKSLGHHLLEYLHLHGKKKLQIDPCSDKVRTMEEVRQISIRTALAMKKRGVKINDVITICSKNHPNMILPMLGAIYLGTAAQHINASYTKLELYTMINLTAPKILFCDLEYAELLEIIIVELELECDVVVFETNFREFLLCFEEEEDDFIPVSVNEDHTAIILCSEGLKGLMKGTMLSHKALYYSAHMEKKVTSSENEVILSFSPFAFVESIRIVIFSITWGYSFLIANYTDSEAALQIMQKYKPTWVHFTPTIAYEISTSLTEDKYDYSNLKIIWVGGDLSTPAQLGFYREKFQNIFVANVCSSTEMLMPYGFFHPIFEYGLNLDKVNSLGRLFPGMEAKIVDPDTKEVMENREEGELLMKSPTMMTGYYKNPEATSQTIDANGWLHTGDLCYIDEEECLFYVDRLKHALKYKLYHIIPYELELIIETHPAVSKACVVGIPHDVDGDHAMAFVEKYPDFEVTADEILEHVNQNVNEYQKLRGGVRFIEKMPLTSSGHIRRNFLKKQLCNSL